MKGGLTVAVFALKAVQATGLANLAAITCVLSADENRPAASIRVMPSRPRHSRSRLGVLHGDLRAKAAT